MTYVIILIVVVLLVAAAAAYLYDQKRKKERAGLQERFGLEYTAADGSRQRPVMIHRALFGSI